MLRHRSSTVRAFHLILRQVAKRRIAAHAQTRETENKGKKPMKNLRKRRG
jgi:hypothetical protein